MTATTSDALESSLLSVTGLSVTGPRGTIAAPMDLHLRDSRTLVIVGESGSGKTMTARALTGLLPSGVTATGSLTLAGPQNGDPRTVDLSATRTGDLRGRGITLLLQDPFTSLSATHRCGHQIGWALPSRSPNGETRRDAVARLLAEVGLEEDVARRRPFELSGGMRQRVALAAALAADPAVLIADEPTTALDVTTQRDVLDLIDRLRAERHMGLLLITHDLAVARDRADTAMVMWHGDVVEEGPADDVLRNPTHEYTRRLLAADPGVDAAQTLESGQVEVVEQAGKDHALLRVSSLSKRFPGTSMRALDDVTLTINRGETLAVVGESGSGKTTLARCIVGLEQPDAGTIDFTGTTKAPRRAQIVFQDPYSALNPAISVGASVAEGVRAAGGTSLHGDVSQLLELVGLPSEYRRRRPQALSGGERQRVAISRALAVDADLLILDESVSALDVSVQAQILDLIADLQERLGLTMLFITHDLAVARQTSTRTVVMRKGRIVEQGPTENVLLSPTSDYTKRLLESIPGQSRKVS